MYILTDTVAVVSFGPVTAVAVLRCPERRASLRYARIFSTIHVLFPSLTKDMADFRHAFDEQNEQRQRQCDEVVEVLCSSRRGPPL